ncbi:MAG: hypothetical protein WA666_07995 [Nitrospirota bacterium]
MIILVGIAFFSNLPLGYLRKPVRKFSALWFLYIHASIPFLIMLRLGLGISFWYIPLSLIFAVTGQVAGARSRAVPTGE